MAWKVFNPSAPYYLHQVQLSTKRKSHMAKFIGYRCSLCGEQYSPTDITYTCPKDGGNLDVVLDYDAIKNKYKPDDILSRNDQSLWRYLPLLPEQEPPGA